MEVDGGKLNPEVTNAYPEIWSGTMCSGELPGTTIQKSKKKGSSDNDSHCAQRRWVANNYRLEKEHFSFVFQSSPAESSFTSDGESSQVNFGLLSLAWVSSLLLSEARNRARKPTASHTRPAPQLTTLRPTKWPPLSLHCTTPVLYCCTLEHLKFLQTKASRMALNTAVQKRLDDKPRPRFKACLPAWKWWRRKMTERMKCNQTKVACEVTTGAFKRDIEGGFFLSTDSTGSKCWNTYTGLLTTPVFKSSRLEAFQCDCYVCLHEGRDLVVARSSLKVSHCGCLLSSVLLT